MKTKGLYKGTVVTACKTLGVSKSGYYNHLKNLKKLESRENMDLKSKELIDTAYNYRGYKKGSRSIVMYFTTILGITINCKKVQHRMRKFDIFSPIRGANPYKRIEKATKKHNTVPNILKRNFNQGIAKKVLLTDITYLPGAKGFIGYLSTIEDGVTNEISAYYVSDNFKLDISL